MTKKIIIAIVTLLIIAFLALSLVLREKFKEEEQREQAEKEVKKQEKVAEDDETEPVDDLEEPDGDEELEQEPSNYKANNETTSFKYDEELSAYYGKLAVKGYATTEEVPEAFCEQDCETFTYVSFNILETRNEAIFDYIGGQRGNAFVGEQRIGIGCVRDDIIWRYNDSNEHGMKKYQNTIEESKAILNSSESDPITISLQRYLYTSGRGAPDCYSHFAEVQPGE